MLIQRVSLLNKNGKIFQNFDKKGVKKFTSSNIFPMVIESYIWNKIEQLKSAEKYKDQIKRVFYTNIVDKKAKNMIQDDVRRLELIQKFNYGQRVLEVGCSDGSVSIKIAESPKVKKVIGIDVRQSAINDGKKLIKDLLKKKVISQTTAKKIKLVKSRIEDFSKSYGKFNSVCAYEIFEHLAPQDLMPSFKHLCQFIKKDGKLFVSVPNRFPHPKYDRIKRSRWQWFDHRNFFSQLSLAILLKGFFKSVKFYPLYKNEKVEDSLYLIAECKKS